MATCPECGANSRTDPSFEVRPVLVAKPIGSFSLAGAQMKVSAVETMRLSHSCGWSVLEYVEGDQFVASSIAEGPAS